VTVLIAVALLSSLVTLTLARTISSPAEELARTAPPAASLLTAEVVQRQLELSLVMRGSLRLSGIVAIESQNPGVITALDLEPGRTVPEGDVVAEIEGRPLIAIEGVLPLYRDLVVGDRGPDVAQLRQAFTRMGLLEAETGDEFDSAMAQAVADLYRQVGYPPPSPSAEDLRAARQGLNEAKAAAESDSGENRGARRANDRALDLARTRLAALRGADGSWMAMSEIAVVPSLPRLVTDTPLGVGRRAEGPVAHLAFAALEVEAEVSARDRSLVRIGQEVIVSVDALNVELDATIDEIATEIGGSASANAFALRATVAAEELGPDFVDQPVRVIVTIDRSLGAALVVPLVSLLVGPDDTAVVEVATESGSTRMVPVVPGLTADGDVEVQSEDLQAGDLVVVPRPDS